MNFFIILILLSVIDRTLSQPTPVNCGSSAFPTLEDDNGLLNIVRNEKACGYKLKDGVNLLILRTNDLKLKSDDSISIKTAGVDPTPTIVRPPFDGGYIISGILEPEITFNFNQTDSTSMLVEYYQGVSSLTLNADINSQFKITPLNMSKFDITLTKTTKDPVNVEIEGASIMGTSLRHILFNEPSKKVTIQFQDNQKVEIKTSVALASCSGVYADSKEASYEITGPDVSQLKSKDYKCVNIFRTALKGQAAHFEANFTNFLDLVDYDDELTLDDGSAVNRVDIVKMDASAFTGQTYSFTGKELAVIYNSPRAIKPSKIQFKLTIQSKADGGLVEKPGQLVFPSTGGRIRFMLVPDSQQYAAVQFLNNPKIPDLDMTISSSGKIFARFTGNNRLPPIIALNEPNVHMVLDIAAKSFSKFDKSVLFRSLPSSCHKISPEASIFSADANQGSCIWTLASTENIGVTFDNNNLFPNGCLEIQPLSQDKPIYSKCNLTHADILPTFILKQAYINVTLPSNNTHLDASLSAPSRTLSNQLDLKDEVVISSPGYPSSYAWSSESLSYVMNNATNKSYVLTFEDIDLRSGEKILVNNVPVERLNRTVDDIVISNVTTINVTVVRSAATPDFGLRRGFKISAKRYDRIISVDLSKNNLTTPKNLTSLFVKISAPGKRISFKTLSADQNYSLSLYDGRSMQVHTVADKDAKAPLINGSTTSDTLLLSFTVKKPSPTLPQINIEYKPIECNKTSDHVCDQSTRCVPADKLCKGVQYCDDGSDIKLNCGSSYVPPPQPQVIEKGVAGITVFILCVLMLTLGAVSALYGPDLYKTLENRFRSGQYTTFSSTE